MAQQTVRPVGPRRTLLLVEDEAVIALAEKTMLERHGFDVVIVHTGEAAVRAVDASPAIDLVLMDINLRGRLDGTQAASEILARRDLPLIFLSSHTEREVVEKTEGITSYGYIVKNSGEMVLIASVKMAFRLFEAKVRAREHERRLRTSEATARALLDAQLDTIVVVDTNGVILDCNATVARRASLSKDALVGKCAWDLLPPEDARRRRAYLESVVQTAEVGRFEDRRGESWFDNVVYPIVNPEGVVTRAAIVAKDITRSKRAEAELRESRDLFKAIAENAADAIFIKDKSRRYAFVNRAMTEMLGRDREEFIGRSCSEVFGEAEGALTEVVDARAFGGETVETTRCLPVDGQPTTLHTIQTPLARAHGEISSIMGIMRDVTKLKRAESRLKEALREKGELLSELQHRTANSFTMVSAMLSLSSSASDSPEVQRALRDARVRVDAVARMHAMLHESESVSSVELDAYLAGIVASFQSASGSIALRTRLEPVTLPAKQAIALGLIAVELITNAAKHAFPGGQQGPVDLSLTKTGSGGRLEVRDEGVGLPPGFGDSPTSSMGITLVHALAEQTGGTATFESSGGTRCIVAFAIGD